MDYFLPQVSKNAAKEQKRNTPTLEKRSFSPHTYLEKRPFCI